MLGLMLAAAVQVVPDAPATTSWPTLPVLPVFVTAAEITPMSGFVVDEVAAGRCAAPTVADGAATTLTVPLIVRRLPDGRIDAIRPQAIGCPTVEQYAAGLMQRFAARPLSVPPPPVATWYRAGLTFRWPR